ncbi:cysteine proteinase [Coccomyxa subellipsoidea C-169]|uniref:Ubiquitin thioesterase OTU n=1 Tax=Coccomyxa subellipsoidea (strain C-169) TaxID=574566 RepID=I0Z2Z5_COCSC|nr:cysteine proteinase [Coccomyxa subellipsoidea C-169]EIE25014.1 cysteine proteinase [Coccomyxa subellipsoidea C-169]|eukprot:XP_005649558.1 cysteine proteinase [Coccomyxa subellipsoidea C-169]
MQGGDSVSLEKLGVSSDYHKKKAAANRHHREQAEREKIHKLYSSQPETHLRVVPIKGDGRCLFRAMVKGLARAKGEFVGGRTEEADADELRRAVADALCRGPERLRSFKEVLPSIEAFEGGLRRYCVRLQSPTFWGGEVEILILSKMLKAPIFVFQRAEEAGRKGNGYIPIVKYGEEFAEPKKGRKPRAPVKLLYSSGNHYDLLLPSLI